MPRLIKIRGHGVIDLTKVAMVTEVTETTRWFGFDIVFIGSARISFEFTNDGEALAEYERIISTWQDTYGS